MLRREEAETRREVQVPGSQCPGPTMAGLWARGLASTSQHAPPPGLQAGELVGPKQLVMAALFEGWALGALLPGLPSATTTFLGAERMSSDVPFGDGQAGHMWPKGMSCLCVTPMSDNPGHSGAIPALTLTWCSSESAAQHPAPTRMAESLAGTTSQLSVPLHSVPLSSSSQGHSLMTGSHADPTSVSASRGAQPRQRAGSICQSRQGGQGSAHRAPCGCHQFCAHSFWV